MLKNKKQMIKYLSMIFLIIFLFLITKTISASDANSLTLKNMYTLRDRKNYETFGFDEVVGNMAATVYGSISSSFTSVYAIPSRSISNTLNGKSWFERGNLAYKINTGTATMNDLASSPFTMQYSIALPLLNTRNDHLGYALDELSRAFNVPTGPKYYDYLDRELGRNTYRLKKISTPIKIDWNLKKIEFPTINFPSTPKITTPSWNQPKITTPSWNQPKMSTPDPIRYNYDYHRISTPSINTPRISYPSSSWSNFP